MSDRKRDEEWAAVTAAAEKERERWTGIGGFFRFLWLDIVLGMLRGVLSLLARTP